MKVGWLVTLGLLMGCAAAAGGAGAKPPEGTRQGRSNGDETNLDELLGAECRAPESKLTELVEGKIANVSEEGRTRYLLQCAGAGRLTPALVEKARPGLLARGGSLLARLESAQQAQGVAWRWQPAYLEPRLEAEVLWDLLGFTGRMLETTAVLQRAERLADPLMKLWAGVSLLRLGHELQASSPAVIAADAETRAIFLEKLVELKRRELFPAAELTQEKLAESVMVRWLVYPTELARAPDHIELMKSISVERGPEGGGAWTYYVFRFKTDPPDQFAKNGWTAGIAGPFRQQEFPTTEDDGDTFSTFTAWDSATAEQHLSSIVDLITKARTQQSDTTD